MRYHDFKLTEDELFELNMSPTNLEKMAKNIDARAGMEFELIVPGVESDNEDDYDVEPDYDMDESFPTGRGWTREVIDFFMGGDYSSGRSSIQRSIDLLDEAYWEWKSNQYDDWLGNNSDVLFNTVRGQMSQQDDESDDEFATRVQAEIDEQGSDYDQAMEEMQEEYDQEDMWDEFLGDEGISSMSDFANEYNLDWPYMREMGGSDGGEANIDDIASDFSRAVGRPINASSRYHGASREPGKYVVEPDGSLEGNDGETGLEFVSPPLPIPEMLADLDKVVKWANQVGAYTNDSTGLHINVSVPDQKNLDYVKLAMFLGDDYILDQFGRAGNTYAKSALKKIKASAATNPDRVEEMMRQFQGGLNQLASKILHTGSTEKFTSINNRDGWIEFRGPGGDWMGDYVSGKNKVTNTLLRAVVALDVATKPDAFKQEYYKKLYKTLNPKGDEDAIQYFARYAAGELPRSALKSFIQQIQTQRAVKKQKPGGDENYEIIDRRTNQVVGKLSATNDQDAEFQLTDWLDDAGYRIDDANFTWRKISAQQSATPVPGSTQDIQRQRLAAAMPPIDFNGNYEVYRIESGRTIYRFQVNSTAEAYNMLQRWRESMMQPGLNPRDFNVRAVAQTQTNSVPVQGTGSLPPGNARWLVLDRDDNEVYSFVNTTAQSDANQYARNWMINTAPAAIRDRGPFTIVPAR